VDKTAPSTPQGNNYIATLSNTQNSLFNFDIPPQLQGKQCQCQFHLPEQSQTNGWAQPQVRQLGGVQVGQLAQPATDASTAENAVVQREVGRVERLVPGVPNNVGAPSPCQAGRKVGYQVEAVNGLDMEWFQMVRPAAGLFVVAV